MIVDCSFLGYTGDFQVRHVACLSLEKTEIQPPPKLQESSPLSTPCYTSEAETQMLHQKDALASHSRCHPNRELCFYTVIKHNLFPS